MRLEYRYSNRGSSGIYAFLMMILISVIMLIYYGLFVGLQRFLSTQLSVIIATILVFGTVGVGMRKVIRYINSNTSDSNTQNTSDTELNNELRSRTIKPSQNDTDSQQTTADIDTSYNRHQVMRKIKETPYERNFFD